ncbi:hypothetical protein KW787_01830 [Candidatus Pacearchaeota archaeon]|nr:hypothetical protein [Candidatus Pacearchaeota archaeon]
MARNSNRVGGWAFLIGVVLAVILGFMGSLNSPWPAILVIIGLIVGFFNVANDEVSAFLMSGTVLIIASALGGQTLSNISYAGDILSALLLIFVPATILVAIKHVFTIARN